MSSSPSEAVADGDYEAGWAALNKLLRRGFAWSGHERHCIFLNTGGRFAEVSFSTGLDFSEDGRAAAAVDWDLDGDLDLFLTARNGPRLRFLQNGLDPQSEGGGAAYVAFDLVGSGRNRAAIGARVEVELVPASADGEPRTLVRTRRAGEGYLAQSSGWVHFGLGDAAVAAVVVRWPSGAVERFTDVAAGGRYVLVEGREGALPWELASPPPLEPAAHDGHGEHHEPRPSSARRIVLTEPLPMPGFDLVDGEGESRRAFGVVPGGEGPQRRPLFMNVMASWCAPCRAELAELQTASESFAAAGASVLALASDEAEERRAVDRLLSELGWTSPVGFVSPDTLALFEGLVGALLDRETPLSVPTSFLFDDRGRLIVVYVGPVDADRVLADLRLVGATPEQRLSAAVPFPGRWLAGPAFPGQAGTELIAARLRARGLGAAADELALADVRVVRSSRAEMLHSTGMRHAQRGDVDAAIDAFRRAIDSDPKYFPGYRDLAIAFHRQGRFALAVDAYRQALLLRPDEHKTRFDLGLALLSLGDRDGAEAEERRLREAGSSYADELRGQITRPDR